MCWRHGWACTLLRCLSGIVVATALIAGGSAFGAGLVSLALWHPTCQPLASEIGVNYYVDVVAETII